LARIEVKSLLSRESLKDSLEGAFQFNTLEPNINFRELQNHNNPFLSKTIQVLFAYKNNLRLNNKDFIYLINKITEQIGYNDSIPLIRHYCIPSKGLWTMPIDRNDFYWYFCDGTSNEQQYSEVLSLIAVLLSELPLIKKIRRESTLGPYIRCLRDNKLERIEI
jgi:hypothetical protein